MLAREHQSQTLRDRVDRGQLERIGRGIYTPKSPDSPADAIALARLVGLHDRLSAGHCFSHDSAALLHGLPI